MNAHQPNANVSPPVTKPNQEPVRRGYLVQKPTKTLMKAISLKKEKKSFFFLPISALQNVGEESENAHQAGAGCSEYFVARTFEGRNFTRRRGGSSWWRSAAGSSGGWHGHSRVVKDRRLMWSGTLRWRWPNSSTDRYGDHWDRIGASWSSSNGDRCGSIDDGNRGRNDLARCVHDGHAGLSLWRGHGAMHEKSARCSPGLHVSQLGVTK